MDQKARSFQVTFAYKSSFEMYFYYQASEGTNGRNVVFAFNSALSEDCEKPATAAPSTADWARWFGSARSADLDSPDDDPQCDEAAADL